MISKQKATCSSSCKTNIVRGKGPVRLEWLCWLRLPEQGLYRWGPSRRLVRTSLDIGRWPRRLDLVPAHALRSPEFEHTPIWCLRVSSSSAWGDCIYSCCARWLHLFLLCTAVWQLIKNVRLIEWHCSCALHCDVSCCLCTVHETSMLRMTS